MFELRVASHPAVRRGTPLIALVVVFAIRGGMTVTADASPSDIVDVPARDLEKK